MSVLVSVAEVQEALGAAVGVGGGVPAGAGVSRVRLLDVRWSLAAPDGRAAYLGGHLPGAVYVDLETELSQHGEPTDGRHPLPTREALEAAARSWGLCEGDAVVVYDDWSSLAAARAWWLLRHAGVDVRILDGGLAAWVAAGVDVETGEVAVAPGDVTLDWGHMPTIDMVAAGRFPSRGVLIDARAPERYRGEVEPIDPRAGHIPGAINMPTAGNVDAAGVFFGVEALAERFAAGGVPRDGDVAVYCGSGVTAAHEIAALEMVGVTAALYPGSWSQWSTTPDAPVATGP
ncbi:sulfurtransferase [Demequina sp.]|uniref:sulfurtransferase n=1 Tax=Demequina sp. TaxID=2050685 RepID=UPI003A835174